MSPSLPKTFKAAVFEKMGEPIVIKDLDMREPGEGEILIKVLACGVCHSDQAIGSGAFGDVSPRIPGHEVIGEVVKLGPGVKDVKVGARVGGPWHGGHDGSCRQCQRGLFQMCKDEQVNGLHRDGGFAEYCVLRHEAAVPIPDGIDVAEAAPLLCAGVTVFNAIRQMNITHGGTVAIQGLGGLGHLALQYASKMGYRTVALSSSDKKKDFAHKLGAHEYLDSSKGKHEEELQKLGGADLIVVTAPNPEIVPPLIYGLAPTGKIVILAPIGEVKFDTTPMILKGLSVHGWPSGHQLDSQDAIAFAQVHGVKCMIEKFKLEQANEAFEHMTSGKVRFRGVLVME